MSDPHAPLRDDVRLLGDILGEVIRAQEGEDVFLLVERVRAASKSARAGKAEDGQALMRLLAELPLEQAHHVARAFSHFLALANIAESHHRIRRRRAYFATPHSAPQRASLDESFQRLLSKGVVPAELWHNVTGQQVELVLTAHPTEVQRRTLLHKYWEIARVLAEQDALSSRSTRLTLYDELLHEVGGKAEVIAAPAGSRVVLPLEGGKAR